MHGAQCACGMGGINSHGDIALGGPLRNRADVDPCPCQCVKHLRRHTRRAGHAIAHGGQHADPRQPVSYSHLDVYKRQALPRLRVSANIDLRLRALASRSKLWLCEHGDARDWRNRMQAEPNADSLDGLAAHLLDSHLPHAVLIDCSASDHVAARYPEWLLPLMPL